MIQLYIAFLSNENGDRLKPIVYSTDANYVAWCCKYPGYHGKYILTTVIGGFTPNV